MGRLQPLATASLLAQLAGLLELQHFGTAIRLHDLVAKGLERGHGCVGVSADCCLELPPAKLGPAVVTARLGVVNRGAVTPRRSTEVAHSAGSASPWLPPYAPECRATVDTAGTQWDQTRSASDRDRCWSGLFLHLVGRGFEPRSFREGLTGRSTGLHPGAWQPQPHLTQLQHHSLWPHALRSPVQPRRGRLPCVPSPGHPGS